MWQPGAATEGRPYNESIIVRDVQQLAFNHRKLSVNHSIQIQLTTVSEGKVFRRVRK